MGKQLSPREKEAINKILDDVEREFSSSPKESSSIAQIDKECQSIWSDWDFSCHSSPKKNSESKVSYHINATDKQDCKSPQISDKIAESTQNEEGDSDDYSAPRSSESSPKTKNLPPPTQIRHIYHRKLNVDDLHRIGIQPFSRGDSAKLRQTNIDLKAKLKQVESALNHARTENTKLRDELEQSNREKSRQKILIEYLKEGGRKK